MSSDSREKTGVFSEVHSDSSLRGYFRKFIPILLYCLVIDGDSGQVVFFANVAWYFRTGFFLLIHIDSDFCGVFSDFSLRCVFCSFHWGYLTKSFHADFILSRFCGVILEVYSTLISFCLLTVTHESSRKNLLS